MYRNVWPARIGNAPEAELPSGPWHAAHCAAFGGGAADCAMHVADAAASAVPATATRRVGIAWITRRSVALAGNKKGGASPRLPDDVAARYSANTNTLLPRLKSSCVLPPAATAMYCLPPTMYDTAGALTPAPQL